MSQSTIWQFVLLYAPVRYLRCLSFEALMKSALKTGGKPYRCLITAQADGIINFTVVNKTSKLHDCVK